MADTGDLFDFLKEDPDALEEALYDLYGETAPNEAGPAPKLPAGDAEWWADTLSQIQTGTYDWSKSDYKRTPKTSEVHPIRVDWYYPSEVSYPGKLGMSIAPGKKQIGGLTADHDRDLGVDLECLRSRHGVDHLVCLVEKEELKKLEIPDLLEEARNFGMTTTWFPFPDMTAPKKPAEAHKLILAIEKELQLQKNVLVHCKGGLGRTGCIGACFLVWCGWGPRQAINITRAARTGSIQTKSQEDFIYKYWFFVDRHFPRKTPKKP